MVDIVGERATIACVRTGRCLARFGDGEIKLIHGEDSLTERWSPAVAARLRAALACQEAMIALPHARGPRAGYWRTFLASHPVDTTPGRLYGSSFVSRPDEAPWIDTEGYRSAIRALWQGRDTVLVTGGGSLTAAHLAGARSVRLVEIPPRDAARDVDRIAVPDGDIVILCGGAAATILATRLARQGRWAVDLGYIGKFM